MLGLILATLYVAYSLVAHGTQPVAAVESTLGFLWYWHLGWGAVLLTISLLVPLAGIGLSTFADTGKERTAGFAILAASPLVFCLLTIVPALFLGGVYCIDSGIQSGEIVNRNHVIVGGILYGLGILFRLASRSSSSKN